MDLALSDEQKAFKKLARDFLDHEVVPYRTEWDRAESIDRALIPRLADIGFFGLTIPERYGGIGGDYVTYCIGMEELGRADSAVRGIVSVSMGLVGKVILSHGTEEQKQQWLAPIAAGTALGCFGLTEPDTGSDAGNLSTRATRDGDDYVLNGQKTFITNDTWSDVALVFARPGQVPDVEAGHAPELERERSGGRAQPAHSPLHFQARSSVHTPRRQWGIGRIGATGRIDHRTRQVPRLLSPRIGMSPHIACQGYPSEPTTLV
jgi:alkylation response protein AidB-like acyl-CoA dehydrogenase